MNPQTIYDVASEHMGVKEYAGAKHNEKIIKMFADTGNAWVQDDETPWCAAFVGSVLAQCGLQGTGKLNARSYLDWGEPVDIQQAQRGDVVVLWRGNKNSPQGHVAFYHGHGGGKIQLLGGNQGNAVKISEYPLDRLLAVRRVKRPRASAVESKTVQASAVQLASGAGAGIAAIGALDGTAQIVALCIAGVVIVMAAVVMRERLRKWASGDR